MGFYEDLEKNTTKRTENGAVGNITTGHKLVDLNFDIPSFRNGIDEDLFEESLLQDERLTLKWLLFLRDIRGGAGERQSFREFVVHLIKYDKDLAIKFLSVVSIEEYGRWDDYIDIYFNIDDYEVRSMIENKIRSQFQLDMENYHKGKPISLLSKWLPSINASSTETKRRAKKLITILGVGNEKHYRKILSALRKHIDVVEKKMSANEWQEINYEHVPSKANLIYANAFMRHDEERRVSYFESLKKGEAKINADALFLHDIVHRYGNSTWNLKDYDETLEQLWKAQEKVEGFEETVVVRDGSGSMTATIGNSNVSALDVANAITLYCAENNKGEFKDKFITFSSSAKVVNLSGKKTLHDKLERMTKEDDYSTTNIENVFDLILETAKKKNMSQEDLPKTVLIVSDLEYNACSGRPNKHLFEAIQEKYADEGYKMPKLIFWNVNSRTNTIPITRNENGVALISGFSKSLMRMVMSSKLDPYDILVEQLETPRYSCIDAIYE